MSKKNGTTDMLEFQFPQPKEKQTLGQILHNSKEGTYLGRTPASWAKITLFYTIFYIVLAAMFTICMQGLNSTLSEKEPKWKLDESLIGTNPGLGFRPLTEQTERGSIIQFDTKKPEEGRYWKDLLDEFLEPYNTTGKPDIKGKFCDFNQTHSAQEVCIVDVEKFGPCSRSNGYGYSNGRPCILLKLNKIYDWAPQFYDNPKDLPDDMPQDLKDHIANSTQLERQQVWVSCQGQHTIDKEGMGAINFYPSRGFPAYYYPFMNQPGYLSPLIAVQFEKVAINKFVNIECRAWAKNIIYSGSSSDRKGSVTFQLFID